MNVSKTKSVILLFTIGLTLAISASISDPTAKAQTQINIRNWDPSKNNWKTSGNWYDCNGNIDNDPAHHNSNNNDSDPAHHMGMMCNGNQEAWQSNQSTTTSSQSSSNNAAAFNVSTSSNPPPPTTYILDNWWPTDGSTLSGVQPFKAIVENLSVDSYTMYWQVDTGSLNLMATNMTDYPHKESLVDLSGWNWKNNGPYRITFVAKDNNGNILVQKSINISVSH